MEKPILYPKTLVVFSISSHLVQSIARDGAWPIISLGVTILKDIIVSDYQGSLLLITEIFYCSFSKN